MSIHLEERIMRDPNIAELAQLEKTPGFPKDAVLMTVFSNEVKRLGVNSKTANVTEFYTSKGNIYRVFTDKRDTEHDIGVFERMKADGDTWVMRVKRTIDGTTYPIPPVYRTKLLELDERNKDTVVCDRVTFESTVWDELYWKMWHDPIPKELYDKTDALIEANKANKKKG